MRYRTSLIAVLSFMLLMVSITWAAFEPVAESPLLQGGSSSTLFPWSPLVMFSNPASIGLLEGSGVSASVSRPFGLRRLDRTALAGVWMFDRAAVGAAFSLSGDEAYTEGVLNASVAWSPFRRFVLGLGTSLRDLRISGYGRATGFSADAGAAWSPVGGIYSAVSLRGFVRTDLGDSGDPAAPRVLEAAVGVVPFHRLRVSAGIGREEGLGPVFSVTTCFIPADIVSLSAGLLTDPARFWAALSISISDLGLGYGYGEHSSLPGSHFISLRYGSCASSPEPLEMDEKEETTAPVFPLDVNTATEEELTAIPGIGPGRASSIHSWVEVNGPITDIGRLDEVPGIGPSLLSVLREYLEVR